MSKFLFTNLPPISIGFGQEQENLSLFHPHLGELWGKEPNNRLKSWKENYLLALLGDVLEVIADHNKGVLALVSTSQTHGSQPSTPLALTADNVVFVILLWVHKSHHLKRNIIKSKSGKVTFIFSPDFELTTHPHLMWFTCCSSHIREHKATLFSVRDPHLASIWTLHPLGLEQHSPWCSRSPLPPSPSFFSLSPFSSQSSSLKNPWSSTPSSTLSPPPANSRLIDFVWKKTNIFK